MRSLFTLTICMLLLFSVAGCTKSNASEQNLERTQELAQDFIDDLTANILPNREAANSLSNFEVVLFDSKKTYNIEYAENFATQMQNNEDTKLTMVFSTSSFVVNRLIYENGVGYYFRFQYDEKKDGQPLEITTKYIDNVELNTDDSRKKVELDVMKSKKKVATFTFRNVVRDDA